MIPPPHDQDTERLLRAALSEHRENVMTTTDTERELQRFQTSLTRSSRRRTGGLAVAASVALLAAGVGYAVVRADGGAPAETTVAAPRELRDAETLGTTALQGTVLSRALEVLDDEVVVMTSKGLATLDRESGALLRQSPPSKGDFFGPVVAVEAGLWAPYDVDDRRGYALVDRRTGSITAFADVGSSAYVSAGGAGLWGVAGGNDVVQMDPATGRELQRVTLPVRPYGLFAARDEVWAQAALSGALFRIDAASGAVTPGPVLGGAAGAVVVGDELWVADPTTAELVRVDLRTAQELRRTRLPGVQPTGPRDTLYSLAAHEADVYVTTVQNGTRLLLRLDGDSAEVRDAVELPRGPKPYLVDGSEDAVWLAASDRGQVERLRRPTR